MTTSGPSDAQRIVASLDLPTKVALLSGADAWHLTTVPDADLPQVRVADGPHGLRTSTGSQLAIAEALPATCLPTGVTLAASWDEQLLTEIGAALGREARSYGVGVLLGPGLNLKRHPAGGRNFEYLSEDPLVAGRLAAALVRGIQSEGVGACLKHFAANHQETGRMVVDTVVDERTLRELELRAFEIAVRKSRPWTVMSAYNRLNGTYCSDHRWLLTDVLREEWGFDGLVMTDWGGMNDRVAATAAGCDLEMPGSNGAFDAEVVAAVRQGRLPEAAVDDCAVRVVELTIRVAANRMPTADHDADAHHALARRAAAAGTVLLTNDGTLPLSPDDQLALVGAFAVAPRFQGAGSSQVNPTRLDDARSQLEARLEHDGLLSYAAGYDPSTGTTTDALVDEAVEAARTRGRAVVMAGLPARDESEGFDRSHLRLPDGQLRVIDAVLATGVPTVVVLHNGAPVELPFAERAAAVVECYLGGQAGGAATVDVLLGDADPGGRLAESFPFAQSDLAADPNFPGLPRQVEHREGLLIGYRFHDTAGVPARFPFGHGLSYTSFAYDGLVVTGDGGDGTGVTATVTVTNTGGRPGVEVVQLYVRDVHSSVWRPEKELAAFTTVQLDAGASGRVTLECDPLAFAVYDTTAGGWRVEPGEFELLVGASSTDLRLTGTITLTSEAPPAPVPAPTQLPASDEEFARWLGHDVPRPRATRPFDRNSTVADLAESPLGRQVQQVVLAAGRHYMARNTRQDDASTRRLFEASILDQPLRALTLLAGGRPPLTVLDRLVEALNGRPREALSDLLSRLRP